MAPLREPYLFEEIVNRFTRCCRDVSVERLIDRAQSSHSTRIYYGRKYFNYPLAIETLSALGIVESLRIIIFYAQTRLFPPSYPKNFSE